MTAQNGHTVTAHYVGTLPDENNIEFDSSYRRGAPVEFEVGSGRMIQGFNDAVIGMSEGETRSVTLDVADAYGEPDKTAFQLVPKTSFGENFDFKEGGMIQGNGPMGPFVARIEEVRDNDVVLDFNHPLSGKKLTFEITVVSIANENIPVSNWNASMNKAELLEIAKSHGLDVNSRSTKSQIVEALNAQ
ncbi:MAG: peptidylprolyl isomerase [Rhodobacteraceae bacterium]|nr:peptidylprolyl isomerase [Paracoccaceae bacterium]|tara:strand:- start:299 stop:865 length:567 start_codon:yes stop_codon:yes gene_type:complete